MEKENEKRKMILHLHKSEVPLEHAGFTSQDGKCVSKRAVSVQSSESSVTQRTDTERETDVSEAGTRVREK